MTEQVVSLLFCCHILSCNLQCSVDVVGKVLLIVGFSFIAVCLGLLDTQVRGKVLAVHARRPTGGLQV
jgi:hypothetical protein